MDLVSKVEISDLPNHLISHILSFLSTKEAASTSLLSKRWRFLFVYVKNLYFDYNASERDPRSYIEFVDRVLDLQTVIGSGTVNKFSLSCGDGIDPFSLTRWMDNVLQRGVLDLDLNVFFLDYLPYKLLFENKSLVKLRIGSREGFLFTYDMTVNVFLPKLKCLYLDSLLFEKADVANGKADVANGKADVAFAKFLSGCLVLEELTLMNFGWGYWNSCSVSLTTLKRLTLFCHHMEYMDLNPMNVTFDTPNLVYLSYFDTIAEKYLKVSFNSLIEAHIGLRLTKDQSAHASLTEDGKAKEMVGDATHFLVGICNVKILFLSAETFQVLTFSCKAIPEFKNLVQLTIESNPKIGWESLPGLLKNCPKLKTLVMKGLGHKYNKGCGNVCCCNRLENAPSCLSSSPVKVLNIFSTSGHIYDNSEMDIYQIKYFLEKMPCLEQLVVNYNTFYDNAVFESFKKLEKILRIASPKCKIQVISENLCFSSTLPSSFPKKWSTLPEEKYAWFLS